MWRMETGNRALTDEEWELFRLGLESLLEWVEYDLQYETDDAEAGVAVFDRLTPEQKYHLLAEVTLALRDPDIPPPRHTAFNEGAIMAVFRTLHGDLEVELDSSHTMPDKPMTYVREALLAACADTEGRDEPLPNPNSTETDEWSSLLEEVEDRIFWDYDFAAGDDFLDLPSDDARVKLRAFGIDPDYFLSIPDDPTESGLISARQTFAKLLDLPMPDDEGLYPALEDMYHSVLVGPCPPDAATKWETNPWVQMVGMVEPKWDCEYAVWNERFAPSVPMEPFELKPSTVVDSDAQLPKTVAFEKHGDNWVVKDADGSYWCDLLANGWTDEPDDDDTPLLLFPSKEDAISGFIQANQMYDERADRYEAVLEELDAEDDG